MEEIKRLVADIKSVCMDRLDAMTADGKELKEVFEQLEELLNKKK